MWKCPMCGREFKNTEQDHFCVKPNSIDEYIATQPEDVAPCCKVSGKPSAQLRRKPQRKFRGRCRLWQDENLIHFAAFKKHIGLYPGGEATSEFAERLTGYKTSKGEIQFPPGQPIDYELIADIVRWRVKRKAKGSGTL